MSEKPHFFNLDKAELEALLTSWSMPRFRAGQLLKWVYERGVIDPQQMTDFSKADRDKLTTSMTFTSLKIAQHQSASDGTQKLLLECGTGSAERGVQGKEGLAVLTPNSPLPTPHSTECVMIPSENASGSQRRTACISSQVGCPVGCRFCASGLGGLETNLTAGQIVEQIWKLSWELGARRAESSLPTPNSSLRITNVVFMGMGEPLSNFTNVTKAVRTLAAPWAFNISARKITISTVGLPAQIRRLADQLELPVTLALSLHAPNDDLRRELIPWAEYTTIDALIEATHYYFQQTGREITLEYILLRDTNDRPEHAQQLAALCKRLRCNVNLIRYNEVKGLPYGRPDSQDVHNFQQILRDRGVNVHIRASRGRDIAAACGQLRHEQKSTV